MKPNETAPGVDAPRADKNISNRLNKNNYNDKFLKVKPVTKAEIISAFEDTLSSSAIQLTDDGYEVIGKWCRIIKHDTGDWDVWLIAPARKINSMVKKLPQEWGFKIVDGEAWCYVNSAKEILNYLSTLGIKRKKRLSEGTRRKLKEGMAAVRNKAAGYKVGLAA